MLVTISEQWMVANFDDVLNFLSYIARPEELDSLREASGAERQEAWDRFWARRDPIPATATNEYLEEFFERVRTATEYFGEPGRPGWQTDRGEVYIILGRPDEIIGLERPASTLGIAGLIEWIYYDSPIGRLDLQFVDRTGVGRYELTPSSRSAFRNAARRMTRFPN